MHLTLPIEIQSQPTDSTCGATCLQAIYSYWGDETTIPQIIGEIPQLKNGGTLAVQLACHALNRGYLATIYTFNVRVFDPTWFRPNVDLADRLRQQREVKRAHNSRLAYATDAYLRFLELGGVIKMQTLERSLIKDHIESKLPMLAGLSATCLYQEARERPHPPNDRGISGIEDDLGGDPIGHFVVLSGYDHEQHSVMISDPLHPNPKSPDPNYWSPIEHVATSILLGIVTYDSNLLVIRPPT